MKTIKSLLYDIFSCKAIEAAATCAKFEDIKYCAEQKINRDKLKRKVLKLLVNDSTFKKANIDQFKAEVNELLKANPNISLFETLTETEHFAVSYFYYHNVY